MVAGPCCVFGATATDAPPDVVAGEGAASDGVASDEVLDEERSVTSSSADDEELPIAKIISHRDTRGQPNDPVLAYYTVRFAGLEDFDEEFQDELPEEELLRRAPKLLRSYRRDAADAAAKTASQRNEASARPRRGRKAAGSRQPIRGGN